MLHRKLSHHFPRMPSNILLYLIVKTYFVVFILKKRHMCVSFSKADPVFVFFHKNNLMQSISISILCVKLVVLIEEYKLRRQNLLPNLILSQYLINHHLYIHTYLT